MEEFFRDVSNFFKELINNDEEKKDETVLKGVIADFSIEEKSCDKKVVVENVVEEKVVVEKVVKEKVDEEKVVEEKVVEEKVVEDKNDFEDDMVIIETTTQVLLTPIKCNENYI